MKRGPRRVCIVGLGHFGGALACALSSSCEVLALDRNMAKVNEISDHVQRALCVDSRDYQALSAVVDRSFEEAIVSIGEGLEASVLCTLHLRRIGVPSIRAKANNEDHAEILRAVGATQVVFPERETAERLARQIQNPNLLDFVPLAKDYRVMRIVAPRGFHGHTLVSLQIRNLFDVLVIAIQKHATGEFVFMPQPQHVLEASDVLVLIGRERDIHRVQEFVPGPPSTPGLAPPAIPGADLPGPLVGRLPLHGPAQAQERPHRR